MPASSRSEADNFDLSYEAYLSPSTSFTLGLFYKKLENTSRLRPRRA
jgi:hypothetical protein